MKVVLALFADGAFMSVETWPTQIEAVAFIAGCSHAAKLYEREMTGYLLPIEEKLMKENEDDTEYDRAMSSAQVILG